MTGKLIEVLDNSCDAHGTTGKDKSGKGKGKDLPHDALIESWIHVEIDRETDRADLKQITKDLLRVLSDVREAVEDWEKMRDAALRIADELPTEPTADDLRDQEVDEARELLRWLAADHFTFLGYREYELTSAPGESGDEEDVLTAVAGTGLGILRSDPAHSDGDDGHPVSPSFNRLPKDARAKAREHRLLILTKANSRSTVHRPSYLDYVGVKKFDADGNVIGERRFLGLFSSAAYTESVRRVPVMPPQGRRGPGRGGLHREQPRRPRPAADPGDVPARRAVPDARRPAAVHRHQRPVPPGAPPAAAVPAPGRVRALLLGAGLPAARPLHHRRTAAADRHPQGGTGRHQRRLHRLEHRVDPLPAALRRPRPARRDAAGPHRRGRRAHRGASGRGGPVLGRRLRGGADRRGRRGARRRAAAPLQPRLPRGLQGRQPAAQRGRRPPAPGEAGPGRRQGLRGQPVRAGRRGPRRAPLQDLPHR
ncbi:hypothetical protein SRIMM317S_01671 [Streptomyces rimosus subsp. rimosus]